MKTTNLLMLAGLAAMTLGVGAANAQNLVPSSVGSYWTTHALAAPTRVDRQIPSGASDRDQTQSSRGATPIVGQHLQGAGGIPG
jgi:hypothetical protein